MAADAARLGDFVALSGAAVKDIPRAMWVVVPECGHIPHLEHPGQFLGELLPFLAGRRAPRPVWKKRSFRPNGPWLHRPGTR
jgi:hypothetical protein